MPHVIVPAEKLEGEPAERTPEAIAAELTGPVRVQCSITTRGTAALCKTVDPVPESLERSIQAKLRTWRFQPATYDGAVAALEATLTVPLVTPPPGWELPKPPEVKVLPFGAGMTPPRLVAGDSAPVYTRKAREMCVEGRAIARCTITEEGVLTDCYMLKSLPYLDESVLATLGNRRYTPVMYEGRAQRVYYTLPFTFRLGPGQ
jgi:TonB family protein